MKSRDEVGTVLQGFWNSRDIAFCRKRCFVESRTIGEFEINFVKSQIDIDRNGKYNDPLTLNVRGWK